MEVVDLQTYMLRTAFAAIMLILEAMMLFVPVAMMLVFVLVAMMLMLVLAAMMMWVPTAMMLVLVLAAMMVIPAAMIVILVLAIVMLVLAIVMLVSEEYKKAKTQSEQIAIAKDFGVRYSCLNDLPYFDPIRRYSYLNDLPYFDPIHFSVVDPMHNIYLGTAKHVMHIWQNKGILRNNDFDGMENTVSNITMPNDLGRISLKIRSSFSGFSADQWRNWVTKFTLLL